MVWSAYMGLPLSLAGAGAVLGLPEQKLKEGKELIKYFCQPCAPTKANGGRTRNLPENAPDKWAAFKRYNVRDVEVEMSIQEKLAKFPVPEMVWEQYHLDQEINDRGVALDMELIVDGFDILLDAALGEEQLFRDLAVVQPLCHQPDNLIFPLGQRRQGFRTVKSGLSPLCGFSQFDDLRNRSGLQPLCQQWLEITIILRKRNDKAVRFRVGQCLIELRLCLRMLTQHSYAAAVWIRICIATSA